MLNGRLYRAAFVPFLFALALAAFSLGPRPLPLTSTLAPDAFEGQPAFEELRALGARYPDPRPRRAAGPGPLGRPAGFRRAGGAGPPLPRPAPRRRGRSGAGPPHRRPPQRP